MRRSIIKIAILICSIVVLIGCYNETDSPNAPSLMALPCIWSERIAHKEYSYR